MTSKVGVEEAGNDRYRDNHLEKMLKDGFSFSGYERDGLYLNRGDRSYLNISGVSGVDSETDGRAAVFADFDDDGDTDIFLTTIQGESHLLFRNNVGNARNHIRVSLQGRESGTDAFGTVVRVETSAGTLTKVKSGGAGYLSQHDPRLLFGLGDDDSAASVAVTWPSGRVQRFGPVAAGSSVSLIEGASALSPVDETPAQLPDPLSAEASLLARLHIRPGALAPDLTLSSSTGAPTSLHGLRQPGRRRLVNLWATWCVPCRTEIPELEKLRPEFEASGIDLIGISLDARGAAPVTRFLSELGATYPNYIAGPDVVGHIYASDEVFVPLSFVIDDRGVIEDIFGGWSRESLQRLRRLVN